MYYNWNKGHNKKLELYGAQTPCAALQLHAAGVLLICFVMFLLCVYVHAQGYTIIFNFAGREREFLLCYFAAIVILCIIYCLFVTLLISSCHHSYYLRIFNSQCVRAYGLWCTHMQIIAVGVANRRDQQKEQFVVLKDSV